MEKLIIREAVEENLLDSRELRDKNIDQWEVLEKVKQLLLIPKTEYATTQQVADFYEVGTEGIKTIAFKHRNELLEDGLRVLNGSETKDFLVGCQLQLTNAQGHFVAGGEKFAYRSNRLFPRRAILRIGMLLRDSVIAKEVRTQLLNIEEKTSIVAKLEDITEEQSLAMSLGMAYASGNEQAIITAHAEMAAFKNRHIIELQSKNQQLEVTNKALANGILEWKDRSRLNFAIRKLAVNTDTHYGVMWNNLYRQLSNNFGMNLRVRAGGRSPYIQHVTESEWG